MASVSPVVIDSSSAAPIVNVRGYNFDKLEEILISFQVKQNGEVVATENGTCQMLSAEEALYDYEAIPAPGVTNEVTEVYGYLLESYDRVILWPSN